jgi:Laminin G domain.
MITSVGYALLPVSNGDNLRWMRFRKLAWLVLTCGYLASAEAGSLRFFGTGAQGLERDIDRVKIRIDPPTAADLGASDFTIDFWLKAQAADNTGSLSCGVNDGWITGNIVLDRDIYGPGPDYGLALGQRPGGGLRIGFGASDASGSGTTLCSTSNIGTGHWHHIAIQRRQSDGRIWLFVDGVLEATGLGPSGSLAYPDGRATSYPNSDPFLVLGAEKHDAGTDYPSFVGSLGELRLSTSLRYPTGTSLGPAFIRPASPQAADEQTAAIYRFGEGAGTALHSSVGLPNLTGSVRFNSAGTRPQWQAETPFSRPWCLDLDGNGAIEPATDGVLLLRAILGFRGEALTHAALAPDARRTSSTAILAHIAAMPLDFDGDGRLSLGVDGLLLLRLMQGRSDADLVAGLDWPGRPSGAALRALHESRCAAP